MNIKIGDTTFDNAAYDEKGDVLYLHVGQPRAASDGDETPEGHAVRFGEDGSLIGLTIINARWLLDRDGEIVVTMPKAQHVPASALEQVLAA